MIDTQRIVARTTRCSRHARESVVTGFAFRALGSLDAFEARQSVLSREPVVTRLPGLSIVSRVPGRPGGTLHAAELWRKIKFSFTEFIDFAT